MADIHDEDRNPLLVDLDGRLMVSLNPIEVNKINLQPGDSLIVKMKGSDFDTVNMEEFGKMLRKAFPSNKVIILSMDNGHSIDFDVVNNVANSAVGCNTDVGYCNDCSCGKKEQALSERE